tara:strand:+ start:395 stop:619 length:225 start_codon:yes stop_codon:yes gene_type:complete
MTEIIGWIAMVLILVGYYFASKKMIVCWVTWFIGNVCNVIYSYTIDAWPQLVLAVALMILNIYGWINWLEDERR